MPLELTVIVPTYNEVDNIEPLYKELSSSLNGFAWNVIFVDDDSPDGTAHRVQTLAQQYPNIQCIHRIGRRGLSSACIEGILATSAPCVVVTDADMQHDISKMPLMFQTLVDENLDCVIGSRYVSDGSTGELPRDREKISRIACIMGKYLFRLDVEDTMSGFFVIRKNIVDGLAHQLYGKGFKILLDILVSSKTRLKVKEIPYTMRSRKLGESKLSATVIYEYLALLANKFFGRLVPTRFILFSLVGLLGVGVHLLMLWIFQNLLEFVFIISQAVATLTAMTHNYIVNNLVSFSDYRLRGKAFFRGLLSFYIACTLGALINLLVSQAIYDLHANWLAAGFIGAIVGAIWNFLSTSRFTWKAS